MLCSHSWQLESTDFFPQCATMREKFECVDEFRLLITKRDIYEMRECLDTVFCAAAKRY